MLQMFKKNESELDGLNMVLIATMFEFFLVVLIYFEFLYDNTNFHLPAACGNIGDGLLYGK